MYNQYTYLLISLTKQYNGQKAPFGSENGKQHTKLKLLSKTIYKSTNQMKQPHNTKFRLMPIVKY